MRIILIASLGLLVQGCYSGKNSLSNSGITIVNVEEIADRAYPNSEIKRNAAKQLGKAFQEVISNPQLGLQLKNEPDKHIDHMAKAVACMSKMLNDTENEEISKRMRNVVLSTPENRRAYIKFNANVSGGVYPLWKEELHGAPCEKISLTRK